jgi:acyl carrier protein
VDLNFIDEVEGKNQLRKILADVLDVDEERIKDDTLFIKDLGVDSLMALEVLVTLEKKYKIKIAEKELPQLTCLKDVYELLKTKKKEA